MKAYSSRILLTLSAVFLAVPALAQATADTNAMVGSTLGYVGIGIGIMMGLAVLGGTLGQSKAAAMALDGIARNPAVSGKLTVPFILSLALIESLVLFAFLIGWALRGSIVEILSKLVAKM